MLDIILFLCLNTYTYIQTHTHICIYSCNLPKYSVNFPVPASLPIQPHADVQRESVIQYRCTKQACLLQ